MVAEACLCELNWGTQEGKDVSFRCAHDLFNKAIDKIDDEQAYRIDVGTAMQYGI